ncbi:MAG: hypothetical protein LBU83_08545, partial [Bacteroidales bacterium]|nr:hypothetical protein [Bacteroidales bacterium]
MNGKFLHRMNFSNLNKMFALLMMTVFFIAYSPALKAQVQYCNQPATCPDFIDPDPSVCFPPNCYTVFVEGGYDINFEPIPDRDALVGAACSRIAATIVEDGDGNIRFDVIGVGPFEMEYAEFGIFYNRNKYKLSDKTFTNEINYGGDPYIWNPGLFNAVTLSDTLIAAQFALSGATYHRQPGTSSIPYQASFLADMAEFTVMVSFEDMVTGGTYVNSDPGRIVRLFSFYLKKTGSGAFNPKNDIGLAVLNTQTYSYTLSWGFGIEIDYITVDRPDNQPTVFNDKNLFLFRSDASVETGGYGNVKVTGGSASATLKGTVDRPFGPICPNPDGILDEIKVFGLDDVTPFYGGRLEHDKIIKYGFIYTKDEGGTAPDLSIEEYLFSKKLEGACSVTDFIADLNGASGGKMTLTTCDGGNFYVVFASDDPENFSINVTGLEPDECYYYWAFATYTFETSIEYPLIGERKRFCTEEEEECDVIVGTIYALIQPTCGESNGSIKVAVTGADDYEYILNGELPYAPLVDGTIGNLKAGHYTVTVRAGSSCNDISQTLSLINSDAATIVSTLDVTDAATCSSTGSITFTVSGSFNYSYWIDNGSSTPV